MQEAKAMYDGFGKPQVKFIGIVKMRKLSSAVEECGASRDRRWALFKPIDLAKLCQQLCFHRKLHR